MHVSPSKLFTVQRNALAHGYFKVDLDVVWKTVERDLPLPGIQVDEVLQSLGHGGTAPSP
ncbi:MAG: HepT-like ribonuclease domain-containing protein [Acidiferrobacterales bacterium]